MSDRVRLTVEDTGEVLHDGPAVPRPPAPPMPPFDWLGTLVDVAGFAHGPMTVQIRGVRRFYRWPRTIFNFPGCEDE